MTAMSLTTTHLSPPEGGWTADDLARFPDDGLRYELVDGVLLVSASPSEEHQIALGNLFLLLAPAAPEHLRVFLAPFDVRLDPRRQLQPDIVVVPKDRNVPDRRPLLVVEVLSPTTRATDSTLKRHVFEQGAVPSYWLVDLLRPSVTVLELEGGGYVERAHATGDQACQITAPFAVRVVPSELVR